MLNALSKKGIYYERIIKYHQGNTIELSMNSLKLNEL